MLQTPEEKSRMAQVKQVYERVVPPDKLTALLERCPTPVLPPLPCGVGIQEMARIAMCHTRLLTQSLQTHLNEDPETSQIARGLAAQEGLSGPARLVVGEGGQILLTVELSKAPYMPRAKKTWGSNLPALRVLREMAASRGIPIDDLGRSKTKIMRRLETFGGDSPAPPVTPPPPVKVTPPAQVAPPPAKADPEPLAENWMSAFAGIDGTVSLSKGETKRGHGLDPDDVEIIEYFEDDGGLSDMIPDPENEPAAPRSAPAPPPQKQYNLKDLVARSKNLPLAKILED